MQVVKYASRFIPEKSSWPRVYTMSDKQMVSVVCAAWNERENIVECCDEIVRVMGTLPEYDFELIVCDNDSTDGTLELLREIAARDKRVKVIANSRNFGAARSAFNGLMATQGDAVIFAISADLQDPPSYIPEFVQKWKEGYQVIYGVRAHREESFFLTGMRKLYYRLIQRVADFNVPVDVGDFQLLDKKVVDALRQFEDYYPYTRGLIAQTGFKSVGINYTQVARKRGTAKGKFFLLLDMGLNGLISFTNLPMRICMLAGLFIASLSILFALVQFLLLLFVTRSPSPPGIPTLIVALFFFSGVQLFFLGVLGEYISAIHFQVRKRPLVIEKERINFD
jgi:glycosyltransferase involved in cell wall biosynthesis